MVIVEDYQNAGGLERAFHILYGQDWFRNPLERAGRGNKVVLRHLAKGRRISGFEPQVRNTRMFLPRQFE
jgi:hypothetical protein